MATRDAVVGRRLVELDRPTALALLASVEYGRIVFTAGALPAIRPVNHWVDHRGIVISTQLGGAVAEAVGSSGMVVAYQADQLDPPARTGWSVVVTGHARRVTDPAEVARLEPLVAPWVDRVMDTIIRVDPAIVTGFRLVGTH